MHFEEINMNCVKDYCEKLYQIVKKDYDYDLVIFVAKGGYLLGKYMADFNHCEFVSVSATRKGNKMKNSFRFILKRIPKNILKKLRALEVHMGIHQKNEERKISFNEEEYQKFKTIVKRILIIDDSIDTGNTAVLVIKTIQDFFPQAEVRFAALNVMKKSQIYPDYYLFQDVLVKGPWSSDSKENKLFLEAYSEWLNHKK